MAFGFVLSSRDQYLALDGSVISLLNIKMHELSSFLILVVFVTELQFHVVQ